MSEQDIQSSQIVVFSISDASSKKTEYYGIDVSQVREIRLLENVTFVPQAPSYVMGVMNLRGQIIPVIDLKAKLGFFEGKTNQNSGQILVTDIDNLLVGLKVDVVEQVSRISISDVESIKSEILESALYIKGIVKTQNKLIVLLDLKKLQEDSTLNKIMVQGSR